VTLPSRPVGHRFSCQCSIVAGQVAALIRYAFGRPCRTRFVARIVSSTLRFFDWIVKPSFA
jgi:hypothetical protein